MNWIEKIKTVTTFEALLILRDKMDQMISDYKGDVISDDYHAHEKTCKYRNLVELRIIHLIGEGEKLDQIEKKVKEGFQDWIKEVSRFDNSQCFLLERSEIFEWQDWFQKGLTPKQAIDFNYHKYG